MLRIFLVLSCFLVINNALAETCNNETPWIVYGQTTTIPNGTVVNPASNIIGLRGEQNVPFTVPDGRELRIKSYGGEAYNTGASQGVVYVPFIGTTPPSNPKMLHSVYASERSNEVVGVNFIVPSGHIVNFQIQSSYSLNYVVGWYISGVICDTM